MPIPARWRARLAALVLAEPADFGPDYDLVLIGTLESSEGELLGE